MAENAVTAFHTEFTVPVAGGELVVGVAEPGDLGAAPMVLGVHDITGSHRMLVALARHLAARGITFVVPDLRGRGASAGLPGPYGLDAHVADLVAVLDHWGGGRAILAGHSMGAYIVDGTPTSRTTWITTWSARLVRCAYGSSRRRSDPMGAT